MKDEPDPLHLQGLHRHADDMLEKVKAWQESTEKLKRSYEELAESYKELARAWKK